MYGETLPSWFWIIYYLFLILTFGTSIHSVMRKRMIRLSIIAVISTLTVPVVGLINSIGRDKDLNEMEYMAAQLQQGSIWAIYMLIGFFYLLVWWGIYLLNIRSREQK
ncbi:hypothetical protein J7I93_15860 [Bacillus sp. ISL-47]|uniref:hypothetical protein n=1 Tax=Bacillus sp. ISL-47 TaxID=2819130 RepID=UPI001BED3436|nr:hypothetical protein [Bacillus sp. ISL-47]MBT2689665.1 hypothetical protein [Bacillus sp. ISL-47]MBT2709311.1 hypothetical protein [Pseudomonas sp. ISL-84]